MRVLLLILFLTNAKLSYSQWTLPNITQPTKETSFTQSKFILELRKLANYVIAYRQFSVWNEDSTFHILAVRYSSVKSGIWTPSAIVPDTITQPDTLKSRVKLFLNSGIFTMTNTDGWKKSCDSSSPSCGDCTEYEFIVMTQDKVKCLYFYEPKLYLDYCSVYKEDSKIIDIIDRLWK